MQSFNKIIYSSKDGKLKIGKYRIFISRYNNIIAIEDGANIIVYNYDLKYFYKIIKIDCGCFLKRRKEFIYTKDFDALVDMYSSYGQKISVTIFADKNLDNIFFLDYGFLFKNILNKKFRPVQTNIYLSSCENIYRMYKHFSQLFNSIKNIKPEHISRTDLSRNIALTNMLNCYCNNKLKNIGDIKYENC